MAPDDDPGSVSRISAAAADDAGGIDASLLKDFLPNVLAAATAQRTLRRAELDQCRAAGREAAEQGVAPRAVVDLYLSAAWRLWRDHPDFSHDDAAALRESGLAVLRAADDGVASLMEGFQRARADLVRLEEATRHSVVEGLLAGGRAASESALVAGELGLDLAGPCVVVVVEGDQRFDGPRWAGLPSRVERALSQPLSDSVPLVVFRDGMLLGIVSAPTQLNRLEVGEQVREVMVEMSSGGPWRIAVSRRRTGTASVATSFTEGASALRLADEVGLPERLVDVEELALYQLLLRDRAAANDLVEITLAGLRDARGGPDALLDTLYVYFGCGGVATVTAEALHLSVRAVTYRLSRVADLIGRDPTDPAERLTLQAAVTVAKLTNWPDIAENRQVSLP